ncbi:hypothetical protein IEO21_07037 [Rhodonia placenta]|uniref:Uncharacterized protein n=1 Tax=Rhodonia placenta TaxID=104341 RepID=A0A8H7NYY4_9APHY|nr:hypothetical protein IEO21_07037 [Postia placenta]
MPAASLLLFAASASHIQSWPRKMPRKMQKIFSKVAARIKRECKACEGCRHRDSKSKHCEAPHVDKNAIGTPKPLAARKETDTADISRKSGISVLVAVKNANGAIGDINAKTAPAVREAPMQRIPKSSVRSTAANQQESKPVVHSVAVTGVSLRTKTALARARPAHGARSVSKPVKSKNGSIVAGNPRLLEPKSDSHLRANTASGSSKHRVGNSKEELSNNDRTGVIECKNVAASAPRPLLLTKGSSIPVLARARKSGQPRDIPGLVQPVDEAQASVAPAEVTAPDEAKLFSMRVVDVEVQATGDGKPLVAADAVVKKTGKATTACALVAVKESQLAVKQREGHAQNIIKTQRIACAKSAIDITVKRPRLEVHTQRDNKTKIKGRRGVEEHLCGPQFSNNEEDATANALNLSSDSTPDESAFVTSERGGSRSAAPSEDLTLVGPELSLAIAIHSGTKTAFPRAPSTSECVRKIVGLILSLSVIKRTAPEPIQIAKPSKPHFVFPALPVNADGVPILTARIREDIAKIVQMETDIIEKRRAALNQLEHFLIQREKIGGSGTDEWQDQEVGEINSPRLSGCEQFWSNNLDAEEPWHTYIGNILSTIRQIPTPAADPVMVPASASVPALTSVKLVSVQKDTVQPARTEGLVISEPAVNSALVDELASVDNDEDGDDMHKLLCNLSKEAQQKALTLQKKLKTMREEERSGRQVERKDGGEGIARQRLLPYKKVGGDDAPSVHNAVQHIQLHQYGAPAADPSNVAPGLTMCGSASRGKVRQLAVEAEVRPLQPSAVDKKRAVYEAWLTKRAYEKLIKVDKQQAPSMPRKPEQRTLAIPGASHIAERLSSSEREPIQVPSMPGAKATSAAWTISNTPTPSVPPTPVKQTIQITPISTATPSTPNANSTTPGKVVASPTKPPVHKPWGPCVDRARAAMTAKENLQADVSGKQEARKKAPDADSFATRGLQFRAPLRPITNILGASANDQRLFS